MVTIIGVMKPRMDDGSGCSSRYGRIHPTTICFIQFLFMILGMFMTISSMNNHGIVF